MLGLDARAAKAAWTVFLVALLLLVLYFVREALLVFVLAVLFAYLLSPLVNLVDRFLPGQRSRGFSLAIVYVIFIGLLVLAAVLIGNRVVAEASTLQDQFPKMVTNIEKNLAEPGPAWLAPIKRYILGEIQARSASFGTAVLPVLKTITKHLTSVLSSVIFIVLIPILGFFFLKDGKKLLEGALTLASPRTRMMWEDIAADLHQLLGQYMRALVLLSLATFTAYGLFLSAIGIQYALLLAAAAGALEFIPLFGPLAAAISIIAVSLVTGFGHVLLILAFLAAYRIFQDYILSPQLMSAGMELHPVLVIFGVLAGEELGGIPGIFLSVPVLAALRLAVVRIRRARSGPAAPSAPTPLRKM
jgi:predicted PurR-regulated permease PerM